ncbi:MAG TPA: ABC transporter ATP-binding protein [Streptosporangiaceae bacterium]|nr:ABC transporter ATP-binding protein [Streptosporangiaceae bacterium]
MTQYSGWVPYGGPAKIELAVGLLAVAGGVAYAGTRLRRPVRLPRPGPKATVLLLVAWFTSIPVLFTLVSIYVQHYVHEYPAHGAAPADPVTPVTLLAAVAVFAVMLTRGAPRLGTRLGSALVAAMAAPMVFELPFDLIVMARTYPPLYPDPAGFRVLFFAPLILIELLTMALLTLVPAARLTRATFYSLALMTGVFAGWALVGFGYPDAAAPIAFNVVSKVLAFVAILTLFFPREPARGAPAVADLASRPGAEPGAEPAAAADGAAAGMAGAAAAAGAVVPAGPAVVVRGLHKSFGHKEAVAGIDLEIAAGSLAGLVGPNGAGKTTSLSMMTGLLRPDAGQIVIGGRDVWADPPAAKAIMGVVPAEVRLFERLSGEEMLEYAGRLRGLPAGQARSRAAELLDLLDLAGEAKRLVADYSTGMRKKIALGCALIHNPPVLFLDEPLEGVDPVSADVIRRLLTRYAASGSTVLFSSHVMELVEQVCDHVSIIDRGQIVASGTTAEVRGGQTLLQAFIDLVGARQGEEELSWLGSSSS